MRKISVLALVLALSSISISGSAATASSSAIKLSEIDCNNEWFEIINTGLSTINLKDFSVKVVETDETVLQNEFSFSSLKIKPGKFKTFSETDLGFGLGCGEESIILYDAKSKELDRVAIPNLLDGFTWSRFGSSWSGSEPTQNHGNIAVEEGTAIDKAAWIYDPMQSFRINLTISQENMDALVESPKVYVPATFRFRDSTGILLPTEGALEVGVRTKGSVGSTNGGQINIENGKIGLKIKFNEYVPGQKFIGLKRMTLNNMIQDPTMVHETLAYKLFTDMGLIAPRTGFAKVYIDAGGGYEYKGLYLNLESYDEIMMARWRSSMQHMYDATWAPLWNGSECNSNQWTMPEITISNYMCNFEVDRGSADDRSDIEELAYAVDGRTKLTDAAKRILDVKQTAKFFALEKYINHWDGQSGSPEWTPNNFRLYSNKDGKFEFLPWGTDGTWFQFGETDGWAPSGLVNGLETFYYSRSDVFKQCLQDDQCKSEYLKALVQISAVATFQDFAQELFDAHESARTSDTLRFTDEPGAIWNFNKTVDFMIMRGEMATDFAHSEATGNIRWTPKSKTLSAGSKLTATTLNAYSDVLGKFTYSKKLGSVLKAGKYSIKVTFTPKDINEWPVKTKTIKFTVK